MPNTIKSYLQNFLQTISEELITIFESKTTYKKIKKGEVVISYGKPSSKFYILVSGLVGSFITNDNGNEFIRTIYFKNQGFSALSALINKGSNANANFVCLTDCEVYEMNCSEFTHLKETFIEFATIENLILENACIRTEKKIDELSFLDVSERYLNLINEIPNIGDLIPQYQIAYYLKTTPVQLSRVRKKLLTKKII